MARDAWYHPQRPMQAGEQAASTVVWVNNGANGIWCKWDSYRIYRAGPAPSYFSLSRSLLSPLGSFTRVACFGYLREEGRSQGVQDFVPILNAWENGSQGQVKNKENWFGGQGHYVKGPECCQNIFIIAVFVMEKTGPCVRRLRGESRAWKGVWESKEGTRTQGFPHFAALSLFACNLPPLYECVDGRRHFFPLTRAAVDPLSLSWCREAGHKLSQCCLQE